MRLDHLKQTTWPGLTGLSWDDSLSDASHDCKTSEVRCKRFVTSKMGRLGILIDRIRQLTHFMDKEDQEGMSPLG